MENPNNPVPPATPSYYRTIDQFISDSELMLNNTLGNTQIAELMEDAATPPPISTPS